MRRERSEIVADIEYFEEQIREYDDPLDKEELECLKEELKHVDVPGQMVLWEAAR